MQPHVSERTEARGEHLSLWQWLRFGPWLAQVVIIRRCNLSCGYCSEYDKTSEPIPFDLLEARLEKLRRLRTWTVCLTGGEPTLHPRLPDLVHAMRRLGFRRRQLITNGFLLTRELIEQLNAGGLTDMQISVDGVAPNAVTVKTLRPLRAKLELLARHARFHVVMSGVIGSAPPEEALEVIAFAENQGFSPRILLIHDETGHVKLTTAELATYQEARRRLGRRGREAGDYRRQMIETGQAPFKCRSGSRYLYVDEFGNVNWCAQTRGVYSKELLGYGIADLRAQFGTPKSCNPGCTVGCARTASAYDEWRPQRG
ncbi:MAG TPA: radical SAM protein [Thermoanaerobaculia bacterium]|nr:radical SAM protein [Thermoanaerobaculia bacterium]